MLVMYAAYLIRCWRQGSEIKRVEVVHVQSGERAIVGTTQAALDWIEDQREDQPGSIPGNEKEDSQ